VKNLKKQKKTSKAKEIIKILYQSEKGRALLFFGFYLLFFVLVGIMLRTTHQMVPEEKKEPIEKVDYTYKLDQLEKKNYHYQYLVTFGEDVYFYEGDCNHSKELFTVTSKDKKEIYFRDGAIFIKAEDSNWIVAEDPYILSGVYDITVLKQILAEAKFLSKTEYDSGKSEVKFSISSTNLHKILTSQTVDTLEDKNEIILYLDKNKNIEKLEYNLTSYVTALNQMPKNTIIEISYSNFGGVKEIEKP